MLKRSSTLLRAVVVVVAAFTLVLAPGLAGAASAAAAVPARAAVACTEGRVPAGYYVQEVFGEPNECSKCQFAGVSWELKGGYTAFCKHFADATYPTAWLYIRCDKCREGTQETADTIRRVDRG